MSEMLNRVTAALNAAPSKWRKDGMVGDIGAYMARAAIEAMREPTEHMILSGYKDEMCQGHDTENAWRHMIDAALTGGK